ncbi:hypothetical protein, partial [Salmonella enterica]|uniref:hypothetical protein n=1 Tax=Salmonella enterica TaxID=28901 RepID=UPI00160003D1
LCLFIPMGRDDIDFFLGQQSHLSNVVLAMLICLSLLIYISNKNNKYIAISCISIILMSAEAPIRALLVIVPLAIFLISFYKNKLSITLSSLMLVTSIMGALINSYLRSSHFPLQADYSTSSLISLDRSIDNFFIVLKSILVQASSSEMLHGNSAKSFVAPFYFLGVAYSLLLLSVTVYGVYLYIASLTDAKKIKNKTDLICSMSSVGFVFGLIIISCLNPDSGGRHILWAICLLKICIFSYMYQAIILFFGKDKLAHLATAAIAIIISSVLPIAYLSSFKPFNYANFNPYKNLNTKIIETAKEYGVSNIYGGDFWRMIILNSYNSGITSAELDIKNGSEIIPKQWLTRPSYFCKEGNVMYLTKGGVVDDVLEKELSSKNATVIYSDNTGKLWIGPVVWERPQWCN